jgi:gamma-glutamyltranspeptidase/glutathione hydrolase
MPRQLIAKKAAVAAGHPLGAAAALEILIDGGNAIDAAVAATLALCVVIPGSVGLGGYGGSAVIRLANSAKPPRCSESVVAVDFGSCAPLGFREGFVTADPRSNHFGPRSVTVPGVVAGLELILREFGTKSWLDVSLPAIQLAEEGFEFDAEHQRHFARCAPNFDPPSLAELFPDGAAPKIGGRWRQPKLARLLHQLAADGPAAFYEGEIAQQIVRFIRNRGGFLDENDFGSYRPRVVDAIGTDFEGYSLYTPPPPSGGITSLSILQTVERLLAAGGIDPWSALYFHRLADALKCCWRERNQWLGDPDVVKIPIARLLGKEAADSRAQGILSERAQSLSGRALDGPPEQGSAAAHTANVVAIDDKGNLISLTATQGWMYGSHLVVDGLGLVLNHGMSRFDYSPGHPNAPAPGKRMQHNMSPMIALGDGQPAFTFGMPGGPKIVSVTAQLVLDTIAFGATPAESIEAPRLHTDGKEPLLVSTNMPAHIVAQLEGFGHTIRREEDMGGPVNVLAVDPATGMTDIASGESTGDVAGIIEQF